MRLLAILGSSGTVTLPRALDDPARGPAMKTPSPLSGSPIFSEIHSHTVWLSLNLFTLGFREIEAWLATRGIGLTYDILRRWCLKFDQALPRRGAAHPDGAIHGTRLKNSGWVVAQWLGQQVYPRFPKEPVYRWPLKKSK